MNVGLPGPFPVSDSVAWGGAQEYAFLTGPQVLLHRVSQRPERPSLREPEATLPSKGLERAGRGASFIPTSHGGHTWQGNVSGCPMAILCCLLPIRCWWRMSGGPWALCVWVQR